MPASVTLTVLAGPTAVGKGTVVKHLLTLCPDIWLSISATTRPPRPGEIDGEHYHFVDEATFDEMVADDAFLEWATVHGTYRYGTPAEPVRRVLAEGRAALLEIDLAGARAVKARMPKARMVFLLPPSWEELARRLASRATENDEQQARRLATARIELAAQNEFDHLVVNDEVDRAAREIADLMGLVPIG